MIRYGKTNAEYMRQKAIFYDLDANRDWVQRAEAIGAIYRDQPARIACVVCEGALDLDLPVFALHGAHYGFCANCGHFNGHHQDTPAFARALYESGLSEASAVYGDRDRAAYDARVASVYAPKAAFMCDALRQCGEDPARLRYVDLGAGAGHYVTAMRAAGLDDAIGYDASDALVDQVNTMFAAEVLRQNPVDALPEIARSAEAEVITMIFSLEHIEGLRDFMAALRANPRVRYFYFAVPTVSPSLAFEALFPEVMPRILGFGHTHLFSERSIARLCEDFGLALEAQWWFGSNAFDLHRYVATKLARAPALAPMAEAWDAMLRPMIDDLQLVFDRHRMASEAHLFARVRR